MRDSADSAHVVHGIPVRAGRRGCAERGHGSRGGAHGRRRGGHVGPAGEERSPATGDGSVRRRSEMQRRRGRHPANLRERVEEHAHASRVARGCVAFHRGHRGCRHAPLFLRLARFAARGSSCGVGLEPFGGLFVAPGDGFALRRAPADNLPRGDVHAVADAVDAPAVARAPRVGNLDH